MILWLFCLLLLLLAGTYINQIIIPTCRKLYNLIRISVKISVLFVYNVCKLPRTDIESEHIITLSGLTS